MYYNAIPILEVLRMPAKSKKKSKVKAKKKKKR